jgi:hypothetical protein
MIDRKSLLSLNFYKKEPFTGSDGNMRYRVEKIQVPEHPDAEASTEEDVPMIPLLQATIWPGPYAFAKTPEDKKTRHTASFSDKGLEELVAWMNEQGPSYQ